MGDSSSVASIWSLFYGTTPKPTHAHQWILLLNYESGLAGTAFSRTGGPAFSRLLIRTSRRALGLAVLVNLVFRRALLPARRALVSANAHQRPPLQHNKTTLTNASSSNTAFPAVPVASCEAARCAATSTPGVHLVGTLTFPSTSRAALWTDADQRFPFFHHKARFADAAFSSADFWASFGNWSSACRGAQGRAEAKDLVASSAGW